MINPFTLARALTESVNMSHENIPEYDFGTDNISECIADMNYNVMSEAVSLQEFITVSNELLAEAAITNPARVNVLHENVFTSIRDGVLKFFEKIISMVKSVIAKLKAHFYKLTNNISGWVRVMEPKINATKKDVVGYADVSAPHYKWNKDFILKGMVDGVSKLVDQWRSDTGATTDETINKIKDAQTRYGGWPADSKGKEASDSTSVRLKAELDNEIKLIKGHHDTFDSKFHDTLSEKLGVPKVSSTDAVWTEVTKKAYGGAKEKVDTKYGSEVDNMLAVIKNSSETINSLKKSYEAHLQHLTEFKSKVEKESSELEIANAKDYPTEIIDAAKQAYKEVYGYVTGMTSAYETAMNTARQKNIEYVQAMTSEYMSLLMKFVKFKGTKK